jgi:chromosome segregation ATPase
MEQVVFSWPAAVAAIAAIITLTAGIIKLFSIGRSTTSVGDLQNKLSRLEGKTHELEIQLATLQTNVNQKLTQDLGLLREDMRSVSQKMDSLVREVVLALTNLTVPSK